MPKATKVYVCYRQTKSASYQSRSHEFGFEFNTTSGAKTSRARQLCEAIVKSELGVKIGQTRKKLDALAEEFFDVSWQELSTGVEKGNEEL